MPGLPRGQPPLPDPVPPEVDLSMLYSLLNLCTGNMLWDLMYKKIKNIEPLNPFLTLVTGFVFFYLSFDLLHFILYSNDLYMYVINDKYSPENSSWP